MTPVRVALVGTRGFGRVHLENLRPLLEDGRADLVGVVDVIQPEGDLIRPEADALAPWFPSLEELFTGLGEDRAPEVVIIATPIATHVPLALEALAAGCHVLLEKPPVRSLAEHRQLLRAAREARRSVQVGFQSRGGGGIDVLRDRYVLRQDLGRVLRVTAYGAWSRDIAYYGRSAWAGRRRLDGERVADGVATNPLAHAVHAALTVAGIDRADQIAEVTTELRHAHDIEADDTTYLGVRPVDPMVPPVHCALVTTAPGQSDPWIEVVAENGRVRLSYTQDQAEVRTVAEEVAIGDGDGGQDRGEYGEARGPGDPARETFPRRSLVENLLEHARDGSIPLICPLASTEAFTAVLDATQSVPDPVPIGPEHVVWEGEGTAAHPVVRDIERWMHAAIDAGAPFAEVGAPFGSADAVQRWSPRTVLRTQEVEGTQVAVLVAGDDVDPLSSPRPYLHPLRTPQGLVITDAHPADHDWHHGLGVVLQDVGGVNFWGGRTYVRDEDYVWRADHGRIVHEGFAEASPAKWTQTLRWKGPDPVAIAAGHGPRGDEPAPGSVEMLETRQHSFSAVSNGWRLDLRTSLRPVQPEVLDLGSPGSNGREGGGYGGLFLRLAPIHDVRVTAPGPDGTLIEGEEVVHGARAPWIRLEATLESGERFSVRIEHLDEHDDPWFVRIAGYPGIGSSLAWDAPVRAGAEAPVERAFRLTVCDDVPPAPAPELGDAAEGPRPLPTIGGTP